MPKLSDHRVLIVNDDGIHAPGIGLLERLVSQHTDNYWVIAPDEERSGASNSVSMHNPVRIRRIDERHISVKGTPTDCVLMALYELMPEKPTLVLSGINRGANLAEDALYSGTIAAAIEASLLGLPSIALSQVFHRGTPVPWDTAEHYALPVIEQILTVPLAAGTLVNVNFPPVSLADARGIRVVRQGRRPPGSFKTEGRVDCREVPYYWIKLVYEQGGYDPGTDLEATRDGYVAVCPLQVDMTAYALQDALSRAIAPLE